MTAAALLAWITGVLPLQLGVGIVVVLRRRRTAPAAATVPEPVAASAGPGSARAVRRCWSLPDRPDPSVCRVTLRRLPAPAAHPGCPPGWSANHVHDRVQVGDILRLKAPPGHDVAPGHCLLCVGRPAVDRPLAGHPGHAADHRLHRQFAATAQLIRRGNPARLLRWHEALAWVGSLLVLVHAGVHFNAILGWLAVGAMLINVGSGLTGKYLLARARRRLEDTRQRLRARGLSDADLADRLCWHSLTFDVVQQWRVVHFPIPLAVSVLALAHILATVLFWGWA